MPCFPKRGPYRCAWGPARVLRKMGVVSQARSVAIDIAEVVAAIESIYIDELKPYARIVRKRLEERAAPKVAEIDMRLLRLSCEQSPKLIVATEEEGGDWFVLLRHRAETFVDVYSPEDVYPPQLWREAACYFEGLGESEMVLPGGRYSCAQVLRERRLPFLEGRSLGQVCHIVQLGISQKKLLGYLHGAVVPYSRSQTMLKDACARKQRPCAGSDRGGHATWEELRACLQEVLRDVHPGTGSVPLSNMKRLFRSRFGKPLSETALGHAKLSELFQDHRLCDLCAVRLQGQGYVLVPLPPQQQPAARQAMCFAGQAPMQHASFAPSFEGSYAQEGAAWAPFGDYTFFPHSMLACGGSHEYATGNAPHFSAEHLQIAGPLPTLLGSFAQPLPSGYYAHAPSQCKEAVERQGERCKADLKDLEATALALPALIAPVGELETSNNVASMEIQVKNTFINIALPSPWPTAGSSRRSHSCPRNI